MLINEASRLLSEQLGEYVPVSFIRFYDTKILTLGRQRGNRYRDLTVEDVKKLKKVYALSKIGVPVNTIKEYLLGDKVAYKDITKRKQDITKILEGGLLDEF